MLNYTIRAGDTPLKIAQGFTGNAARYGELLAANPQIPTAVTAEGYRTFAYMPEAGENLRLPDAWGGQVGDGPSSERKYINPPQSALPQQGIPVDDAYDDLVAFLIGSTQIPLRALTYLGAQSAICFANTNDETKKKIRDNQTCYTVGCNATKDRAVQRFGRVICGLDAADWCNLGADLCDKPGSQPCPTGAIRNPATGVCECPAGWSKNPDGTCSAPSASCTASGTEPSADGKTCVCHQYWTPNADGSCSPPACPPGAYFDVDKNKCECLAAWRLAADGTCIQECVDTVGKSCLAMSCCPPMICENGSCVLPTSFCASDSECKGGVCDQTTHVCVAKPEPAKSSALPVVVGIAATAVVATLAGVLIWGGKTASGRPPRMNPASGQTYYRLIDGYGYELPANPKRSWKRADDELWDIVMVPTDAVRTARPVGTRHIDGGKVVVFRSPSGSYYAQMEHMARQNPAKQQSTAKNRRMKRHQTVNAIIADVPPPARNISEGGDGFNGYLWVQLPDGTQPFIADTPELVSIEYRDEVHELLSERFPGVRTWIGLNDRMVTR